MVHEPFTAEFCTYPVLSEVALTYRCNLSCGFCYAGCGVGALPEGWSEERVMSDDEVCRVLDVIRHDAHCPSVSFTGGEPTLRPGLERFVRHAKGLGLKVNLISNGQRLDGPRAAALAEAGLDSAQLSLEGPSAAVHDALVERPGAFDRLWESVRSLQAHDVRVHTNTTSTGENLPHAAEIIDLVADRGLERLTMNLVIPCGTAGDDPGLGISYSEIGEHVLRLRDRAEKRGRRAHLVLAAAAVPPQHHRPRPRKPRVRRRRRAAPREPRRRRPALLQLQPRRDAGEPPDRALRYCLAVARRPLLPGQADDAAAAATAAPRPPLARGPASSTGGRSVSPSWAARPRTRPPLPEGFGGGRSATSG